MKYFLLALFTTLFTFRVSAQLKPGFDGREYLELLRVSSQQIDTGTRKQALAPPENYHMIYRSSEGPLKNRWDLWLSNDHKIAVISIRGTTASSISWLENFYAAMVPANGQLHINDTTNFSYHLAENPGATVHIGWLLGLADLSKTIIPQINKLYKTEGIKNFIIMGHSQGAAIAYLLRSYIADLQKHQTLPNDIILKTYCSAPPKPGNIYYVYDYEFLTRGGWSLAITNAADWVPETPFSIQTVNDFNTTNPFSDISGGIKSQPLFVRLYVKHIYNQLKNPALRAQRNNSRYLGHFMYKFIKKQLPQFKEPDYASDNFYMRCGTPIILMPDDAYRQRFPDDPSNVFVHHMFKPYYYLAEKQYGTQ